MRLTLRTLLAYRDRVLSPADSEDLHRRIQISQDAGNLLRRIGAVTQRNAVLAPPVLGKGLGGDPNSIAEYLDDALPHAQVPELERICLVSDVQLAELADCHSLLSTAINTKVSVSSDLRRMALGAGDIQQRTKIEQELELRKAPRRRSNREGAIVRNDLSHSAPTGDGTKPSVAVQIQSPMLVSGGESIRPKGLDLEATALTHEVPDYLMNSASGQWKIPLAIGALASLLAILLWQSLGPWERISELFVTSPTRNGSEDPNSRPIDFDLITETEQGPPGIAPGKGKVVGNEGALVDVAATDIAEDSDAIDAEDSGPPGASPDTLVPSSVATNEELDGEINGGEVGPSDQNTPPGLDTLASRNPSANQKPPAPSSLDPMELPPNPAADQSLENERGSSSEPTGKGQPAISTGVDGNGSDVSAANVDMTAKLKAFSDNDAPPDASNSIGSSGSHAVWLPSSAQDAEAVILWRDGDIWRRVEAGQSLPLGSRLVVPPSTRTTIDLPDGVLWTACGPSQLELVHPANVESGGEETQIVTPLCRALIRGGPDGRVLRISTPVGDFKLDLSDPNSLASIEVAYRPIEPGSIVERESTKPVLVIVAAEESLRVTPLAAGSKSFELSLGDGLACVGDAKPTKFRLQNIPAWFRSSIERPIDSLAISDLHHSTDNKPNAKNAAKEADTEIASSAQELGLTSKLADLRKSRRPETAALAVQLSMLCGDWQPLAAGFLDEVRMRSHWTPTLNLARQLMAIDPTQDADIHQAFTKAYAEEGKDIVNLLYGIPAAQLDVESLAKVVQRLESPRLAMRVVALYQLQLLTGKSLGIQPSTVNRSGVQQWRRELASNRDILITIPDPIWESIPE